MYILDDFVFDIRAHIKTSLVGSHTTSETNCQQVPFVRNHKGIQFNYELFIVWNISCLNHLDLLHRLAVKF